MQDQRKKGVLGLGESKTLILLQVSDWSGGFCTSNSLWAQWMSVHYLKGLHLYQASSSLLDSGSWKWICSMKDQELSYMAKKLGNGKECSVVFNRWLANTSDIPIQNLSNTQLPNDVQNLKVSDICLLYTSPSPRDS